MCRYHHWPLVLLGDGTNIRRDGIGGHYATRVKTLNFFNMVRPALSLLLPLLPVSMGTVISCHMLQAQWTTSPWWLILI